MPEPRIQIGTHVLTDAQAMAVRVAVTAFHADMTTNETRDGLGPIADAYRDRLNEVMPFLLNG